MTLKKPVYNKDDISRNRKEAAVSLLRDVMKYLFLIFLLNTSLQAQKSFDLELNPIDQEVKFIKEKLTYRTKHISKKSIQNELKSIIENLHAQFYLTANIDSLTIQDSTYKAFIFVGQQFKWANLVNGNIEQEILDAVGFKTKFYQKKSVDIQVINQLKQDILTYTENNGYPFARVWLDSLTFDEDRISAKLNIDKKQLITFDKLEIEGEIAISKGYLKNYLGIKEGELYNESLLKQVKSRIIALPFVKEKRSLSVIFSGKKAMITLFLEKQNASRFDFIVGVLPRNEVTGRPIITGSLQADLQNPFGTGKAIGVDWQRLKAETSRLKAYVSYPYILNLPFGIEGNLDIYRRDTSLQDTKLNFGVQYLFQGNNYLKVFWKSSANNVLSVNEQQIISTKKLPNNLDVLNTQLGLAYSFQQLDNRINPQKGYTAKAQIGAGIKQIRRNSAILNLVDETDRSFNFQSLYDSLSLRTFQVSSEATLAYYYPIGSRVALKAELNGGLLFSQDSLYQNELYRIGGNRLLRGFDEESISASAYGILTIEPRLLLNQNSYLFAFLDYAYLQDRSIGNYNTDFPLGFGLGLSLGTPAGIVRMSYAMGKQSGNPIDFRAAKIHFGYVNYF
jgi:outer membrane protein assembly factor BamA